MRISAPCPERRLMSGVKKLACFGVSMSIHALNFGTAPGSQDMLVTYRSVINLLQRSLVQRYEMRTDYAH